MTRPTDPRGASRRIATCYDEDSGRCAEITDCNGDFIGIAIACSGTDARRKAQDMIKEASRDAGL